MDRSPSKPAPKRKRKEDPETDDAVNREAKSFTADSLASSSGANPLGGSHDAKSPCSPADASAPSSSRLDGISVDNNTSDEGGERGRCDVGMTEVQGIDERNNIMDHKNDGRGRHSEANAVDDDPIIEGDNNGMAMNNDESASTCNSQIKEDEDEHDDVDEDEHNGDVGEDDESNNNNDDDDDDDDNSTSANGNSDESEAVRKDEENESDEDDDEEDESEKKPPKQPSILIRGPGGVDAVDFPLSNIKDHLICPLCKGYFRDPYTVADCLHSFCRSCLILTFRLGHRRCPTCNTSLEPDPFREVLADRTLQEVVDKIFPWMKTKEDQEEKEFYARRGIELKPEYAEDVNSPDKKKKFGLETRAAVMANKNECPSSLTSPIQPAIDQLDFQLEPDKCETSMQQMPPLNSPSLRTSGRLKVKSIKKYLLQKLGLKDAPSSVEVLCNGDPIGDELSLTFILRTRWFNPNKILTLNYRLSEEFAASQRKVSSKNTAEVS